jgi:hypothetical protein
LIPNKKRSSITQAGEGIEALENFGRSMLAAQFRSGIFFRSW